MIVRAFRLQADGLGLVVEVSSRSPALPDPKKVISDAVQKAVEAGAPNTIMSTLLDETAGLFIMLTGDGDELSGLRTFRKLASNGFRRARRVLIDAAKVYA
jgi:hypothetical protein